MPDPHKGKLSPNCSFMVLPVKLEVPQKCCPDVLTLPRSDVIRLELLGGGTVEFALKSRVSPPMSVT